MSVAGRVLMTAEHGALQLSKAYVKSWQRHMPLHHCQLTFDASALVNCLAGH